MTKQVFLQGVGKAATLKSMLNLIRADSGEVKVLGKEFIQNEFVRS